MATREAVTLEKVTGQIGFAVSGEGKFTHNLLAQVFNNVGTSETVSSLVFSRKVWQERPEKGQHPTVIIDLTDSDNRRLYFMDDNKHLYGEQPFNRDQKDKLRLSLAVVLIEPLTTISEPVVKADLEAISKKLVTSGGLIVVEKRIAGQLSDQTQREEALEYTPGFKYNRFKQPEFLVSDPQVIVWETRRKKPNKTWTPIKKRNQERMNKKEGVGIHKIENLNAGLDIVEVGEKGVAISRVGEEDGVGPIIESKSSVVVREIKTNAERRLSFGLEDQKNKAAARDAKKFFVSPEMLTSPMGFPIKETCNKSVHGDQKPQLIAILRKLKDNSDGTIKVLVNTACSNCGTAKKARVVNFKNYEKIIGDKTVVGWVSVN